MPLLFTKRNFYKMIKGILISPILLLAALPASAAVNDWNWSQDWAFNKLVTSDTNDSTVGWFFTSDLGATTQELNGVSFTGLTVGTNEGSGSNGILSWSSASGYSLGSSFYWGAEYSAQNAMSGGGLWSGSSGDGTMSLDLNIAAGTDYVIELVSLQESASATNRTFDLYVDGALIVNDYGVPNTDPYNVRVKLYGTSDGVVDIDFALGSSGDPVPAFSIITVTEVPEPATTAALFGLASLGALIVRRRLAGGRARKA